MTEDRSETNQSFYDRISEAYDLLADAGEHKARETGEAALGVQPGEHVLELGFGTGNSIVNFAESVGTSGDVCGIDISPGMLAVAGRKVAKKRLSERVALRTGDARELPYEDASFDAVFMSFTLELFALDDIPKVLAEIRRVLKRAGRVGVVSMATVKENKASSQLERAYIWMHRHFPHIVDCQPIDVEQWIHAAGFQIVEIKELRIWTMPVRVVIGTL